MSYQTRTPAIKLKIDVPTFNSLIEFISRVENFENEVVKEKATKLEKKLLRYSIPITNEENQNLVEIRFFPNEATSMIDILLYSVDNLTPSKDYYNILLEVRKRIKEQNK